MKRILLFFLIVTLFYGLEAQVVVKPNLNTVIGDTVGIFYDGKLAVDAKNKKYGVVVQNVADTGQNKVFYGFLNSLSTNGLPNASPIINGPGDTTFWARVSYHNQFQAKQGTFNVGIDNTITEDIGNVTNAETSGMTNTIINSNNTVYGVQNNFTGLRCPTATGFGTYLNQFTFNNRTTSVQGLFNNFTIDGDTLTYGLRNVITLSNNSTGRTFGVYSNLKYFTPQIFGGTGGTGARYGVYSRVEGSGSNRWAGYFEGDVVVTGTFLNLSDLKIKENITNYTGALTVIKNLTPKQYHLKSERENPLRKKHTGLVAQEVESVFPDIVSIVESPGQSEVTEKKVKVMKTVLALNSMGKLEPIQKPEEIVKTEIIQGTPEKFKSVNYIELVPILLQAIKEQQDIIEQLQRDVEALKRRN